MLPLLLLFLALAFPAGATTPGEGPGGNGATANAVAPNQSVNNQTSSGVINQAPLGGVNTNIQQNNTTTWPYGYGPGIQCPSPSIALGAFGTSFGGGYNSGSAMSNAGIAIAFVIPLGARLATACAALGEEIARQRQLDTAINLVKTCAKFAQDGVTTDPRWFPELERCKGVSVRSLTTN